MFFGLCFLLVRNEFGSAIQRQAEQSSAALARVTFASMYELMSTGWSRQQAESFIKATRNASDNGQRVQIFRGPRVVRQYGAIEQPPLDDALTRALTDGEAQHLRDGDTLRHIFPLIAENKCLACHHDVLPGQTLGAIEVSDNFNGILSATTQRMAYSLAALSALAMLGALVVVGLVNRRIENSVRAVEDGINKVNAVADLRSLDLVADHTGFVELQRILAATDRLVQKLRSVAVDKDILRFEVALLEKFVITSDVIKDWRQYLGQLLDEINQVLTAHLLFSIFQIEDELFDLEVFWRMPPSDETVAMMERFIRRELQGQSRFGDLATVNIHHHVVNPDRATLELSIEDVSLRVKSFFVPTPKIGGIVGIGVHAEEPDETRLLVMDSILSTLMNVIGSVKAIYKHTRDLEYYATRDPLTDLYNQRVFWEMLNYEVSRRSRRNEAFSILLIDLDNFKTINDSYGHHVGDKYLIGLADAVHTHLREDDILARYGGDEFVAILPDANLQLAAQIAGRVLAAVGSYSMTLADGSSIKGSVSIGIATFPEHARDAKDLFLFADNLMYKAKSEGKNRVAVPSEEDATQTFRDISKRTMAVLKAIESRDIIPFYQPILDIASNRIIAYECLSRLPGKDGVISADQFIELAEKAGLIHRIDLIVIEEALKFLGTQKDFDGYIFFNLSPRAIVLNEFQRNLMAIVAENKIAPERIVFEITERDTVRNLTLVERFLAGLKTDGFKLALDDFGSGFSSFHYLRRFPIDFLKLEGDFIINILNDKRDLAFVRNMRNLASELGLKVIAEFVETPEILTLLGEMGIDYAQGYHVGRPRPQLLASSDWTAPANSPPADIFTPPQ